MVVATPASAGGFAQFAQGARGMGLAGADAANSSDASAIFRNPAGIAFLGGRQLYLSGTLSRARVDFEGDAPFPGAGVSERSTALLLPPSFDYSQRLSERLVVGVGVHVPFAMRTRWAGRDTSSSTRFLAKTSDIWSYSLAPALAYKLADRLAVGAGVDVRLSRFETTRNVALFNPFSQRVQDVASLRFASRNRVAVGFNVGVLAKPSESLALGISYRHKLRTSFDGDAELVPIASGSTQFDALVRQRLVEGPLPAASELTFPALLSVGAQYSWGDWLFAAGVDLQQWSSLQTLPFSFDGRPELSEVLREEYVDAQTLRLGVERRWSDVWSFRGGYFFERTPVPVESLSPLLPDATRHGAALGATWRQGRLRVEAANWVTFSGARSSEGKSRAGYDGAYKHFDVLFSVSLGVSF